MLVAFGPLVERRGGGAGARRRRDDDRDPGHELNAAEQIEAAEQGLFNLSASGDGRGDFRTFSHTLKETLKMVEAAYQREGRLTGITSGFADMDRLLGGLQKSDLIILAARPAMGKTALATNIAFNAAKSLVTLSCASPKSIRVFSLKNRGFWTPA